MDSTGDGSVICDAITRVREGEGCICFTALISVAECKWLHLIMFHAVNALCIYAIRVRTASSSPYFQQKKSCFQKKFLHHQAKKNMNCDEIPLEYSEKKGEDEQSKSKLILVY